MRRVVSVSLGSSTRDKKVEAEFLGTQFSIERRGTDGDMNRAIETIRELDGKVDAIGLGGIDLYLVAAGRKYIIRDALPMANAATQTPVVDGSGLKDTWEREVVRRVAQRGQLWAGEGKRDNVQLKVLVTSGVDRFGMAEAFDKIGGRMLLGDLIFGLGLPLGLTSLWQLRLVARAILPIIVRQPFEKLYPTGKKQEKTNPRYAKYYHWADVISGDFHFIRRFMPPAGDGTRPLEGKTLLTNTITQQDVEELRARGLSRLITTTPNLEGRSFGTNVMEGVIVTLLGKAPEDLTPEDYMGVLEKIGWEPHVIDIAEAE